MRCKAIKGDGIPCQAMALEREELCVYHSQSEEAKRPKEEGRKAGKGTLSQAIGKRD